MESEYPNSFDDLQKAIMVLERASYYSGMNVTMLDIVLSETVSFNDLGQKAISGSLDLKFVEIVFRKKGVSDKYRTTAYSLFGGLPIMSNLRYVFGLFDIKWREEWTKEK